MATFRLTAYRIQIKKIEIHGKTKGDECIAFCLRICLSFQNSTEKNSMKNIPKQKGVESYFSLLGNFS